MTPDIATRLPGAAASDCRPSVSRRGTRCRMALTVVSTIAGRSRPLTRARRASAIIRCATTPPCGENPVVGQGNPRREFQHLDIRREEAERARQHRHARTVAANDSEADRRRRRTGGDRTCKIGQQPDLRRRRQCRKEGAGGREKDAGPATAPVIVSALSPFLLGADLARLGVERSQFWRARQCRSSPERCRRR